MDAYLNQRFIAVNQSVQKALNWGAADPELGAFLAGYLVVLISGVYEDSVEYLINRRAGKSGDPELTSYVRERTAWTLRNPKVGRVRDILKDFSTAYRNQFDKLVSTQSTVALDSIVENKNWLAHGETSKMQVTVADVDDYFHRSVQVFEALDVILA